ncbi:MAG TPA: hypothetical protein VIK14_13100 [Ignavibacteria bacterium]
MPEEKKRSGRKVNAWIPDDLYFKVDDLKYRTWTEAIVSGLELLVKSTEKVQTEESEVQRSTENSTLDDSRVQGSTNKSTVDDLEVQKVRIESTGEIRELRARVEELQDHNETLKTELEKAGQREEDLKETHRNYMLQVQTLINQKAIEAPGAKKPWWQFW